MALVVGSPSKLSASLGGEPIPLDDSSVPGKAVHVNTTPGNPDTNDMLHRLLVTNLNSATVSIYLAVTGPGITPPSFREDMRRYDIISTEEGRGTTILPVPLILAPGYQLNVSVVLPPGGVPLLLDGVAFESEAQGTGGRIGYGGLGGTGLVDPAVISASTWTAVPFAFNQTTQYKLVQLDPANDALSLEQEGIWETLVDITISHDTSTQDRVVDLRLFNLTEGAPITAVTPYSIARNQSVSSLTYVSLTQPASSLIGDFIQVQLLSKSTDIPVTLWDSTEFSAILIDTLDPVIDTGNLITHEPDDLVTHEPDQLIYLG